MENFILTKKDCRNIYLKIYFLIVQLALLNFVLAYIMTYVDNINIWFNAYSPKTQDIQVAPWVILLSSVSIVLVITYYFCAQSGAVFKLTFINLLNIFLSLQTHMQMKLLGWKFVLLCFGFSLFLLGLAMFAGSTEKKDYRKYYPKMHLCLAIMFFVYLLFGIVNTSIIYWMDLVLIALGAFLTFLEIQDLRFNLPKVRSQQHLDNLLYPCIMNMFGNFLLMSFFLKSDKIFIKFFSQQKLSIRK